MNAFLITMAVLCLLRAGAFITRKPGPVYWTAGQLAYRGLVEAAFAAWALWLLLGDRS